MTTPTTPPKWLDALSDPRVSQAMGKLVGLRAPQPVLQAAIRTFSKLYGVELDEIDGDLSQFKTFQAFFTRKLKAGARTVAQEANVMPAPADGVFSAFGPLGRGTLIQAKGVEYTLDALLGGSEDADPYRGGSYAVIYLAPNNYHRVHTPWQGSIVQWRYLPGALYPVNKMGLANVHGLFARNERIVGHAQTEFGPAAMVMVGATCVGHMRVAFADLACNEGLPGSGLQRCNPVLAQQRGDEFGVFEMGSTVVLVFARDDLQPTMPIGTPVRMGQPLFRLPAKG